MALTVNLEVRWPNGRRVRVQCRSIPLVPVRADEVMADASAMEDQDVMSLDAFHRYLRTATRLVPDAGVVEVVGFQPTLFKLLELLKIEGPPPNPISIELV
ncbi:hypothetical protein ACFYWY_36515 [Streptomyces sp. NPDC002870]|uniref:hypothetical protein n=1 Tax=Streptomyces sp. NPDC002870 TaxID=3364666 RepID=UPI00367C9A38